MAKYTSDDIKALAENMRDYRDEVKKPFNLLIGAGCSKSAGIPLAPKFVEDINKTFASRLRKLTDEEKKDYGKCMGALSPEHRRRLITPYLEEAKINWAHIAIASMIKHGFLSRILTFNFDAILARSCGLMGQYPATYDFASAPSNSTKHLATPCIIHLHGQGYAVKLINSDTETEGHVENLRSLFRDCFNDAPTLVIGYSGQSDEAFRLIKEESGTEYLYWADYKESPLPHIKDFMRTHRGYMEFLGEADADHFLIELANELGCWPPKLFENPYGHLLEELEPVQDYPVESGSTADLLKSLRTQLEEDQANRKTDLNTLFMKREWDKIIEIGDPNDENQKDSIAWAYVMQGVELYELAEQTQDEIIFVQSGEKYQKAIDIKPDKHEAYNNWGNALANLAKQTQDEKIFVQAGEKYQKSIDLKPDYHEAYFNWGSALDDLATQTQDEKIFVQACEKYQKAIELNPDDHEAYNNWGNALNALAKQKEDAELFTQAFEKYQKAIELNPDDHKAYNNWGTALNALAKQKEDAELFTQAFEKYQKAIELKPDYHEAYNNWGLTLSDLAKQKEDAELFTQACEKFQKAIELNPDYHAAYNNWGLTLRDLAKQNEDAELFTQAFEKYQKAIDIKPDMYEAYYNWGLTLSDLAKQKEDAELFTQAFEKYQKAIELNPDDHEAYYNWGAALIHLWHLDHENQHLIEAREKLDKAAELNPDKLYNLACVHALLGESEECRKALFHCKDKGTLPSKDHLMNEKDFDSVRDLPWFAELLEGL